MVCALVSKGLSYIDLAILTLQDLEILNVGIFGVDIELDTRHGHITKNAIVHLAEGGTASTSLESMIFPHMSSTHLVGRCTRANPVTQKLVEVAVGLDSYVPSSTLLDLGHVELQEAVQPCQEFLTTMSHPKLVFYSILSETVLGPATIVQFDAQ